MRLVLLGPPGAGKGTQGVRLSQRWSVPHISTGDLFRANIAASTDLGVRAKGFLDTGQLVPSELTVEMMQRRLAHSDCANGFLLDGFPRSVQQAAELSTILAEHGDALDAVVYFNIDAEVLYARMRLRGRDDDTDDIIARRLEVYRTETAPLLDHYADLIVSVDADGDVDDVHERVHAAPSR